ncbi:response regulator transcription factor [Spongisporangium articulatum]|uniref:Response regulator transcription factor n=1 Tax=Spongisporangium articulatum TaxID=3362603 RepID=A0ABW8AL54_9ACTN
MALKVVVADDDANVCAALCDLLQDDERLEVTATAENAEDAVHQVADTHPDVAVLDVRMPGSGIEAGRRILQASPDTTVVLVSAQVDSSLVTAALAAGVRGVFVKGRLGSYMPDLVVSCHQGAVVLDTPAAVDGLRAFAGEPGAPA